MATTITAGNSTNGGAAISSDNTGILELKTGTGSGTTGLTINASQNTTLAGTLSAGAITSSGLVTGATGALYPIVSGTAQTAPFTDNTRADFTGIPSWARRVTLIFDSVSTSGSSVPQIRLGTLAGGIEASGYSQANGQIVNAGATVASNSPTTGFGLNGNIWSSGVIVVGKLEFVLLNSSSNLWVVSGVLARTDSGGLELLGGSKSLSGTLDRIRVTTVNGTDTFDTGSTINIFYE